MLKIYKSISLMLVVLCLLLLCVNEAPANKAKTLPDVSLTLIPPSPVTDKITLDIRGAIWNHTLHNRDFDVKVYLDNLKPDSLLFEDKLTVPAETAAGIRFWWNTGDNVGRHNIIIQVKDDKSTWKEIEPIEILSSDVRSTRTVDGAWTDFTACLPNAEGLPYYEDMKKMNDSQWRELIRAMHEIGMNIVVIQEVVHHYRQYVGQHKIEEQGYKGLAYYPSRFFPMRKDIAAKDPLEAVLSEADKLGMYVFPGVGLYAWFDFTAGSLEWHKKVTSELWQRYGHHESLYGWYVSEEIAGDLGVDDRRREEIVYFFKHYKDFVRKLAPDKPIMLAPNCHIIAQSNGYYPKLLEHLDIICPFGFHRMPVGDYTGEEAAQILQDYCDQAGAHLWMDMEVFVFGPRNSLYPRSIKGLISDLRRFGNFEKILCYQFPGLMNAPWMSRKPGGREPDSADTVRLYTDYKQYLEKGLESFIIKHDALGKPVTPAHVYSEKYTGGSKNALTNGWTGSADDILSEWQGYQGVDLIATVDLEEVKSVKKVSINFLQQVSAGIFLPNYVEVSVSSDGKNFGKLERITNNLSLKTQGPVIRKFSCEELNEKARYVKVHAKNIHTIPDWHQAKGERAWLFVDEILVNPDTSK